METTRGVKNWLTGLGPQQAAAGGTWCRVLYLLLSWGVEGGARGGKVEPMACVCMYVCTGSVLVILSQIHFSRGDLFPGAHTGWTAWGLSLLILAAPFPSLPSPPGCSSEAGKCHFCLLDLAFL